MATGKNGHRTGRVRAFGILAVLAALGAACGELLAPVDDYQLPPPDTSLDTNRLSIGSYIATPCAFYGGDRLASLRERQEWATVDVFFGRPTPPAPGEGPSAGEAQLVRSHGGRVLYTFNVPAVRARIILAKIPDLVERGFWITVRDVPDPTRYDLRLIVGFDRALTDADVALFQSLGGRVQYRWDNTRAIAGVLPDRSIPALRSQTDIRYLELDGVMCLM